MLVEVGLDHADGVGLDEGGHRPWVDVRVDEPSGLSGGHDPGHAIDDAGRLLTDDLGEPRPAVDGADGHDSCEAVLGEVGVEVCGRDRGDASGELALIVLAPGSGVGFRRDLNVTTCGLGESSDVVRVEIASDEDDVVGDDDGRTRWWVLVLGVGALVVASARRAATSRRRSGVAGTA